jgi:hypothetical protein
MTDEEVNTELHDDPFGDNIIKAEHNCHYMIKDMEKRAIAAGFRPATSTCPEEEAVLDGDNIITLKQSTTPLRDNNNTEARPSAWTRVYIGIATRDNNKDNRDEEEAVNITWRTWPGQQQDNEEGYLVMHAYMYKRTK